MTGFVSYASIYHDLRSQRTRMQRKGKVFKIALPDRWLVAVNGQKLVDEAQRMPEDKMSFQEALGDVEICFFFFKERESTEKVERAGNWLPPHPRR